MLRPPTAGKTGKCTPPQRNSHFGGPLSLKPQGSSSLRPPRRLASPGSENRCGRLLRGLGRLLGSLGRLSGAVFATWRDHGAKFLRKASLKGLRATPEAENLRFWLGLGTFWQPKMLQKSSPKPLQKTSRKYSSPPWHGHNSHVSFSTFSCYLSILFAAMLQASVRNPFSSPF